MPKVARKPAAAKQDLDQEPLSAKRPVTLPGGPLTEEDYAMLAQSAISRELADAAMLRHLTHLEGKEVYQRKRSGDCEGVYFPNVFPTEPDKLRPSRLRLCQPQNNGKLRYLAEFEGGNRFYLCPGTSAEALADIELPVIVTEGERRRCRWSRCRVTASKLHAGSASDSPV